MQLIVSPKRVTRVLLVVVICLAVASLAGQWSKYYLHHDYVWGLVNDFDVNREGNIPTWYSSGALLASAALLAVVARLVKEAGAPFLRHWQGLSLIFVFLSIDEVAQFHEQANRALRAVVGMKGPLHYPWVLLGALVVVGVGAAYLRFVLQLPPRTRRLVMLAGATYVGGALLVEVIDGWLVSLYGQASLGFVLLDTAEEVMEMLGVIIFIYALLSFIRDQGWEPVLRVADDRLVSDTAPDIAPGIATSGHSL